MRGLLLRDIRQEFIGQAEAALEKGVPVFVNRRFEIGFCYGTVKARDCRTEEQDRVRQKRLPEVHIRKHERDHRHDHACCDKTRYLENVPFRFVAGIGIVQRFGTVRFSEFLVFEQRFRLQGLDLYFPFLDLAEQFKKPFRRPSPYQKFFEERRKLLFA